MKVYIVVAGWWHDGEKLIAVFSDIDKAYLKQAQLEQSGYADYINVEEWKVEE